jgi:hypothetical protein
MACASHPHRASIFIVCGQTVDELDARDGTLRHRIISDLPEPIVRLEVCVGLRGHEYLLLLSAANELRVWDIEGRFHLSAVRLGGGGEAGSAAGAGISLLAASTGHDRCVLFYARAGGWQVEALHLQRQLEAAASAPPRRAAAPAAGSQPLPPHAGLAAAVEELGSPQRRPRSPGRTTVVVSSPRTDGADLAVAVFQVSGGNNCCSQSCSNPAYTDVSQKHPC